MPGTVFFQAVFGGSGRFLSPGEGRKDVSVRGGSAGGEVALTDGFVEKNGGRGGDVERVDLAEHGDHDRQVGAGQPEVGEPGLFGADDDRHAAGHVGVGVALVGVRGGGEDADVMFAQPVEDLLILPLGERHRKERARAGADHVGVVDVGAVTADDHAGRAHGVGAAEHRAQVAGFFDGFGDEVETVGAIGQIREGMAAHFGDGEEAFGAVAVGDFFEEVRREPAHGDALGGEFFQKGHFVDAEEVLRREEAFGERHAVLFGAGEFAVAFQQRHAFAVAVAAVAQPDEMLDRLVLGAGDMQKFHFDTKKVVTVVPISHTS